MFSAKDINKAFDRFGQKAGEKMYNIMVQTGEYAVKKAREEGRYNDITGNLRSSVGYVIARSGNIVNDNFTKSERGSDKATGMKEGYNLAVELAHKYSINGWVLIVVAGMEYAAAVESIEGKDVLSGPVIDTEGYLSNLIRGFKSRLYG